MRRRVKGLLAFGKAGDFQRREKKRRRNPKLSYELQMKRKKGPIAPAHRNATSQTERGQAPIAQQDGLNEDTKKDTGRLREALESNWTEATFTVDTTISSQMKETTKAMNDRNLPPFPGETRGTDSSAGG